MSECSQYHSNLCIIIQLEVLASIIADQLCGFELHVALIMDLCL